MTDSRKERIKNLHLLIMLACLWGVVEAAVGVYLRGTCARLYSGSLLMGGAFFFVSAAHVTNRQLGILLLLPFIASIFRIYAALLSGTSLLAMAVANPIYAFFTETLALIILFALIKESVERKVRGRMMMGILGATIGASLFPAVKYFTGISACVLAGTNMPLALYGLPVAAVFSALTVPLGYAFGAWLIQPTENRIYRPHWKVSTVVSILCIIFITAIYV